MVDIAFVSEFELDRDRRATRASSSHWLLHAFILALLLISSPLNVQAQTGTLFVEADNVGIGVPTPLFPLHIQQNDAVVVIEELNAAEAARTMLRLTNNGRINFNLFDSGTNTNWQFSNTLIGFQINQTTSSGVEFRVTDDGDLFLEGQLFASSSRSGKMAVESIDGRSVLERVRQIPLATWTYKDQEGVRHMGPMAEDFFGLFGLGRDSRTLSPFDTSGVALAAIQGVGDELEVKEQKIARLEKQLNEGSARVEELTRRMEALEEALENLGVSLP